MPCRRLPPVVVCPTLHATADGEVPWESTGIPQAREPKWLATRPLGRVVGRPPSMKRLSSQAASVAFPVCEGRALYRRPARGGVQPGSSLLLRPGECPLPWCEERSPNRKS